jgi:Uri superfamily endonuclease
VVRWHIDQLTERGSVVGSWIFPGGNECKLVRKLSKLPMPFPGFGSSDCATIEAGEKQGWRSPETVDGANPLKRP